MPSVRFCIAPVVRSRFARQAILVPPAIDLSSDAADTGGRLAISVAVVRVDTVKRHGQAVEPDFSAAEAIAFGSVLTDLSVDHPAFCCVGVSQPLQRE